MTARSDPKDKLRAWVRMLRTTRMIEAALREKLRLDFKTTLPRFDVLAALARADAGLTMSALSRQLLVSNGNVTGIVERLVTDRLVVRAHDAGDKRATRVRLTARGRTEFAAMASTHEEWVTALFGRLDASDVRTLLTVLAKAAPENSNVLERI